MDVLDGTISGAVGISTVWLGSVWYWVGWFGGCGDDQLLVFQLLHAHGTSIVCWAKETHRKSKHTINKITYFFIPKKQEINTPFLLF